jgi:hypothetical protein
VAHLPWLLAVAVAYAWPLPGAARDIAWVWPGGTVPSPQPQELAVLTQTIQLGAGTATRRPRRTPLVAAPGTSLTPVVHVQPGDATARLSSEQAAVIVADVLQAAAQSTSGWVQLDFEAPGPMREDWRRLVAALRQALPAQTRLSVTALASWCTGGAWLDALAADEVVPMVFALGPDSGPWQRAFQGEPRRLHARCQAGAAGFSIEAPPADAVRDRYARRYWFHERPQHPYALPSPETRQ